MHGSIFHGFKQFVLARDGQEAWGGIVEAAGARGFYFSTEIYRDEELIALVQATAVHEGRTVPAVLEDFGVALVPSLMQLYKSFVVPSWRTLDLLMNVERVIHRTIRMTDPTATPPHLRPVQVSEREVEIEYSSQRRLCAVAVGICRGVASFYGERITVEQTECMERGDRACRLVVRLTS